MSKLSAFWLSKFDQTEFRRRLISAALLAPVVVLLLYFGGAAYALAVILTMGIGLHEWFRMVAPDANRCVRSVAYVGLGLTLILGAANLWALAGLAGIVFFSVLFLFAWGDKGSPVGWVVAAMPYLAGGGAALIYIRAQPESGIALAFYLVVTIWATDIGAYLSGRLVGGPKLIPQISPKKTWAGLLGGMVFAGAFGYGVSWGLGTQGALATGGFATALAVVAQGGDIFESYVKRCAKVKDSGNLIPGHGGILDRIDGLLFAGIFFVLFQKGTDLFGAF
ncbi:MAG: phosphatidate cytidylyltransferase [Alphaproteobacteria bacterium]|nr:phosphatidate cytidylyltransferase [Alphaproteobacteria bacterium]